jgi:hypothetical protein
LDNVTGGFVDGSTLVSGALATVAHPQKIVLADFQGNGLLDVFVADHGYDATPFPGHQQKLMEWGPDGKLQDVSSIALPQELTFTHRVTVGDIFGNGSLDIFYPNLPGPNGTPLPQLLVNNGTGKFSLDQAALPSSVTGTGALGNPSALLADLNGDGKADLVVGGWDPLHTGMHPCVLYLNNGAGDFSKSTPIVLPAPAMPLVNGTGPIALEIASADLSGDGMPDLVVDWQTGNGGSTGDNTSYYYQILINQGNGRFVDETQERLPQTLPEAYWTVHIFLADLHNDGVVDLVTQPNGPSAISPTVYFNDGTGHFTSSASFGDPGDAIAPFQEGGRTDFAVVHRNGLGHIFLNGLAPPGSVDEQTIQSDCLAITRAALPFYQAQGVVHAVSLSAQTETQYVQTLLSQVANTTIPAVAVEASMYGVTGSSSEITKLVTQYLPAQIANATQNGYQPQVYACEALGLVFAFGNENGGTSFSTNFGPSKSTMPNTTAGDAAFAAAAASTIFGSAATANTPAAIAGFVANWKAFFTANGVVGIPNATADQIDLAARGAAWGDAVGIALANNLGPLPGQVSNFLQDAAQGTATYSASLASQPTHLPFQGSSLPSADIVAEGFASEGFASKKISLTGMGTSFDHAILSASVVFKPSRVQLART